MNIDGNEVIDLCSTTSCSSDEESSGLTFSPVKAKTSSKYESSGSECDLSDIVRQIVPNVSDDYHDPVTKTLPVLARPLQGLSVNQLFTLMIGTVPQDRICSRKPTSVL